MKNFEKVIKYNDEKYLAYLSYFKITDDYHVTFSIYDRCNDLVIHLEDIRCNYEPEINKITLKMLNFLEHEIEHNESI